MKQSSSFLLPKARIQKDLGRALSLSQQLLREGGLCSVGGRVQDLWPFGAS